jgi:hypothetical protein
VVKQSFLARLEPNGAGGHEEVWKSRWITLTPQNLAVYPAMVRSFFSDACVGCLSYVARLCIRLLVLLVACVC